MKKKIIQSIILFFAISNIDAFARELTDFNKYNTAEEGAASQTMRDEVNDYSIKNRERYKELDIKKWSNASYIYNKESKKICGEDDENCKFKVTIAPYEIKGANIKGCKTSKFVWFGDNQICQSQIPQKADGGNYSDGETIHLNDEGLHDNYAIISCNNSMWKVNSQRCQEYCKGGQISWGGGCVSNINTASKGKIVNVVNNNNTFIGEAQFKCEDGIFQEKSSSCQLDLDYKWRYGEWSKCNGNCTHGQKTREVYCEGSDGKVYEDKFCEENPKPSSVKNCKAACYYSCADMKLNEPYKNTGVYEFKLKTGEYRDLYCNMDDDDGGWTLIGNAGKITHSKKVTTGVNNFMPLFYKYGEIDNNFKNSRASFSRFDIFKKYAMPWNEFLFKKRSDSRKGIIFPIVDKDFWGLEQRESLKLYSFGSHKVKIPYIKISKDGEDKYITKANTSWYKLRSKSYPGIDWRLFNNSNDCGTLKSGKLNHRSLLYWETEDQDQRARSQWFHGTPLNMTRECSAHNNGEELSYYYREFNPVDKARVLGKSCADIKVKIPKAKSGTYFIEPKEDMVIKVFCDMETDGGGWIVFQRRTTPIDKNDKVNFYRNYDDYIKGFGKLFMGGEGWLGLDKINKITKSLSPMELRIDLKSSNKPEDARFFKANNFYIDNEENGFKMNFTDPKTDAGDSLSYHKNRKFTTFDHDVDAYSRGNCSNLYRGGWWYGSCHASNLNGINYDGFTSKYAKGVVWHSYAPDNLDNEGKKITKYQEDRRGHYYSLHSEMKIREFNPLLKSIKDGNSCYDIKNRKIDVKNGFFLIERTPNHFEEVYCDFETDDNAWQKISIYKFDPNKIKNGKQFFECTEGEVEVGGQGAEEGDKLIAIYGSNNGIQTELRKNINWLNGKSIDVSNDYVEASNEEKDNICRKGGYDTCLYNNFYKPYFSKSITKVRAEELGVYKGPLSLFNTKNNYTMVFESGLVVKPIYISGEAEWGGYIYYEPCRFPDLFELSDH